MYDFAKTLAKNHIVIVFISIFFKGTFSRFAVLTNPRFAYPDTSQPNGQGSTVGSWPGFDASKAIDGDLDQNGADQVAIAKVHTASFFVDLIEQSIINYVEVWPRMLDGFRDGQGGDQEMAIYYVRLYPKTRVS